MDLSVLLAFPLLLALSTPCSACHCKLQHPQSYYCTSDIVLLVDILEPSLNTVLKRGFRVRILKILKGPRNLPEIEDIYTPLCRDECGYEVMDSEQSQVLIAGFLKTKNVVFTKCHMISLWQQLTPEQRTGFEGAYRRGCKCHIQPCLLCSIGCPEADTTDCVWKQTNCEYNIWSGKHSLNSMCVPSTTGHCDWTEVQASPPQVLA